MTKRRINFGAMLQGPGVNMNAWKHPSVPELSVIRGLDATLAVRGFTPHIICRHRQVLFMDPASRTSIALAD
jgi:hypothetical protein